MQAQKFVVGFQTWMEKEGNEMAKSKKVSYFNVVMPIARQGSVLVSIRAFVITYLIKWIRLYVF